MSRLLRLDFVAFGFVAFLVALSSRSLTEAGWVKGNFSHVAGLWLGLLCGLALAFSRFRGWPAFVYSLALSIIAAGEAVGRVLPPVARLQTESWADVNWLMRVQLLTLAERVNGWLAAYLNGDRIKDTGLFVFLLVVVAWNASAWLAWRILRKQRALEGLLPLGFLLALNVHLSGQSFTTFWGLVVCAVPLAALTAYRRRYADWEARGVDYPTELGYEWAGGVLAITLAIGLLAGIAPLVGAPQGWRLLSDWMRVARLRTVDTAEQLFSGVNPPALRQPLIAARAPNLETIGAPIDRGSEVIMWVSVSDPAPPPPPANVPEARAPKHYWRSSIFVTYTGAGWKPLEFPEFLEPPQFLDFPEPSPGRYELRQHYEIVAAYGGTLFAVNRPVSARGDAQLRYTTSGESALLPAGGGAAAYDVTSWATRLTEEQLEAASTQYPPEITATYLQLPSSLPRRVRDLAERVTADAGTPYAKAIRVQDYLRAAYAYTLDAPPPAAGQDAVDYFLFEAPGGFCSYYASAMAVMLRAVGVPARVAAGYATGDYDYGRGAYRVPANASHAWVEVYFPEYGWVEFEPTAARTAFVYEREAQPPEASLTSQAQAQPPSAELLVWVLAAIAGIVGAAGAASWLSRAAEPAPRTPGGRAQALYRRVRWALAQARLAASPSVTPDEFLAAAAPRLSQKLQMALAEVTQLYLRAAFSPRPPGETETQTAQRLWQHAWPEWVRLLIANRLSRIANRLSRIADR